MKVLGVKRHKQQSIDSKQQKTTQITSSQHSRKNSLYSLLSKYSQTISGISNGVVEIKTTRQKKKFINMTVRLNKNQKINDNLTQRQTKQKKSFSFKFCQQIPKNQNFYTKIISSQENVFQERIINNPKKQLQNQLLHSVKHNSTLTAFESPIIKLMQFDSESQIQSHPTQFVTQLQNLMQRL